MDVVTLPLVDHSVPVTDAIREMQKQQRSGVVVRRAADVHALLYAGSLFEARDLRIPSVGDVSGGERVVLVDFTRAKKFGVDTVDPYRTADDYASMLRLEEVDYSIVGVSSRTVTVVTRSEDMTALLSTTAVYRCTGRTRHYFPKPRVVPGEHCIRPNCLAPDGRRSVITPA